MNREERRQFYGRVRAGAASPRELAVFARNVEYFGRRVKAREEWRATLRALVSTSLPTAETRNGRKALTRARRVGK